MDRITQNAHLRQRVLKYAEAHGVTAAANRFGMSREMVYNKMVYNVEETV